jgi:hypothetical protein
MYLVAASYVALLALIPYIVIWGPADLLGLHATFEDGRMLIRSVTPDSLPAKAGLRAGDQVASIDGRPIRGTQDWSVTNANLEVNRVQKWEILRQGNRIELEITPEQANWMNRLSAGYISYSALAICSFAVGLFIAFRRPYDPAARVGAWFIGTAAILDPHNEPFRLNRYLLLSTYDIPTETDTRSLALDVDLASRARNTSLADLPVLCSCLQTE